MFIVPMFIVPVFIASASVVSVFIVLVFVACGGIPCISVFPGPPAPGPSGSMPDVACVMDMRCISFPGSLLLSQGISAIMRPLWSFASVIRMCGESAQLLSRRGTGVPFVLRVPE